VPIAKVLQPVWQALPENPVGHTQILSEQEPPFWQVVLPHLVLQLLWSTKLKAPIARRHVIRTLRNCFTMMKLRCKDEVKLRVVD